jgi:hypothetical protein
LAAFGEVVEGPAEVCVGRGVLGRELWANKYVVFDARRQRLEVHDPFEPKPLKGVPAQPPPFSFDFLATVVSGTALYKVASTELRQFCFARSLILVFSGANKHSNFVSTNVLICVHFYAQSLHIICASFL